MSSFLRLAAVLSLFWVVSCAAVLAPFKGDTYTLYGVTPIHPVPELWVVAWEYVEECVAEAMKAGFVGRPNPGAKFAQLTFFTSTKIVRDGGVILAGIYARNNREIFLSEEFVHDPRVVIHELLHHYVWPVSHGEGVFFACDPMKLPQ